MGDLSITYNLQDLEDDLDRYSPEEDHEEVVVLIEFDGKRHPILSIENETDRGYNVVVIHAGEWDAS